MSECKECLRLTSELVEARAAHSYALLKSKEAYGRGREQGAADVAVDIATWLETLALEHPQGTLLAELAERVLDAEYMEEEKEAPAHD